MNQPGWDNFSEDDAGKQYCSPDIRVDDGRLGTELSQGLLLGEEGEKEGKKRNESSSDDNETPVFVVSPLGALGMGDDILVDSVMQVDATTEASVSTTTVSVSAPIPSSSEAEDEEDKSAGGRYFIGGSGGQKCFNCGQPGHISKECPEENTFPCFLCGGRDHQRANCPEEVCYNCGRVGHMSRDCSQPRKRRVFEGDYCNRCQMPGHLSRECSLSWRRYVYVREPTRSEVGRADSLLSPYCYNCASDRHWGDECRNRKRPDHTIFHHPQSEYLKMTVLHREDERTKSTPTSRFSSQHSRDRDDRTHSRRNEEHPHRPSYGHTRSHASGDGFQGSDRPIERDQHPFGSSSRSHGHRSAETHRSTQHRDNPAHRGQSSYRGSYRQAERPSQ